MCAAESRRLWTDGDWRDDLRHWAATWQRRPGLAWSAHALALALTLALALVLTLARTRTRTRTHTRTRTRSAAGLMRLPEEPARAGGLSEGLPSSRIALLVCGGGGYAPVARCLRRCEP